MKIISINPSSEGVNQEYEYMSHETIFRYLKQSQQAFESWKDTDLEERCKLFRNAANVLRTEKERYAKIMVTEMGKPIKQAIAEVEKCAWTCEVYADNVENWLEDEIVQADGKEHRVIFQPLGVILSIMPWNFPFWQVFRFAIPSVIVGNTTFLKHSNDVPGCALAIEEVFTKAGFPKGVFTTILSNHENVYKVIESDIIKGLSLTGSTEVGAKIAEFAGKHLKKVVLELGGSDPFVVCEDIDLDFVVKNAVIGRTQNNGQSCIAAKRFIVHSSIIEEFGKRFAEAIGNLKIGDPMDPEIDIGPMANNGEFQLIKNQIDDAKIGNANFLTGGEILDIPGYYVTPAVVSNVNSDMRIVKEEVFGPVAPLIPFSTDEEAIKIANATEFGLGGSVWSKDEKRAKQIAMKLDVGSVFVNCFVKSDPRMPFGGVKKSGIGRELSKYGLKEFVNVKGLNIYSHGSQ
ncbi:MAG: NAD-dependent succinate-semialdehyde dehydrogenase [Candidatus Heimdallarchaeota archaeon]|nr:NAD-dependent succinate-semialdehyde dehydrogenase [Candidatus Heimdallarchaeota archaeon]